MDIKSLPKLPTNPKEIKNGVKYYSEGEDVKFTITFANFSMDVVETFNRECARQIKKEILKNDQQINNNYPKDKTNDVHCIA